MAWRLRNQPWPQRTPGRSQKQARAFFFFSVAPCELRKVPNTRIMRSKRLFRFMISLIISHN